MSAHLEDKRADTLWGHLNPFLLAVALAAISGTLGVLIVRWLG